MMKTRRSNHAHLCLLAVSVFGFFSACSQQSPGRADRAHFTGRVEFRGKALPGGEVFLISDDNPIQHTSAVILNDGRFEVRDAPIGPLSIAVKTSSMKAEQPERYVEIPHKFSDAAKSGLKVEVKAGENEELVLRLE
jgi:hypothetical protein